MRWKFTLILLLLNIVAGWYLYHLETRGDLQNRLDRSSHVIVPPINSIDRLSIELRGEDGQSHTRVLARERERWELLEPVRWPANENAVQNILTQLDFLAEQVTIPLADIERLGQSLAEFGLLEPRVIIRYHTIEGEEGEIKLGSPTKMGRRLYLLPPGGEDILVVQEDLLAAVAIPLGSLRSHRIFDIPPFEIQSLAVQAGEQRIRLVRDELDKWRFETPVSAPANSNLVENTLNLLYGQQALRLLPENAISPELAGLNNPRMRISIGGNNRRQTVLLGAAVPTTELPAGSPPQAYARIDDSQSLGTIFTVFETPFEQLRQAPDHLRQRNFMVFNPDAVTSIQIQRSGESLTLQKLEPSKNSDAVAWQAITGNGDAMVRSQSVSALEVQRLLSLIAETSAVQFVSDSPVPSALATWGLDQPNAEVRLRGQDGLDLTLLLGKNVPEQPYLLYAKTRNSDTVYTVESRIFGALQTSPLAYRNRLIDPLPDGARISELKLTDLVDKKVLLEEKITPEATDWGKVLSDNTEVEREAVLGLLGVLQRFNVGHFLAEGTEAPNDMPWRYLLEVTLFLPEEKTSTHHYYFTARQGQTQIGASQRANMTFTLLADLIDYLTPLTLGANPPAIPATTPQAVEEAQLPPLPTQQTATEATPQAPAAQAQTAPAEATATETPTTDDSSPAAQPATPQTAQEQQATEQAPAATETKAAPTEQQAPEQPAQATKPAQTEQPAPAQPPAPEQSTEKAQTSTETVKNKATAPQPEAAAVDTGTTDSAAPQQKVTEGSAQEPATTKADSAATAK